MRYLLILLIPVMTFATEVPKELIDLLKGNAEQIYIGTTKKGFACEMRVFKDRHGFFIDAYERDHNGEINYNGDFGRFILNQSHELWDFWAYSYGFEAVSYHFSNYGARFDRRSFLFVEDDIAPHSLVKIDFKRNDGNRYYTNYLFECFVEL